MSFVKLRSSDGVVTSVDVVIAQRSVTISTMMKDLDTEEELLTEVLPLSHVSDRILKKVIEWCTQHNGEVREEMLCPRFRRLLTPWDKQFFDLPGNTFVELLFAAMYLDVKDLLDALHSTIADIVENNTAAEIRRKFDLEDDPPPIMGSRLREGDRWCMD